MKKVFAILLLCLLAWPVYAQTAPDSAAIKRGEYIAKLGDCSACHSVPNGKPFAGGLPLLSPFGLIYSTNISPDPQHGIGRYTPGDFSRALRDGVAKDGHHLYPAMPYTNYSLMHDDDMADLYAYFMHGIAPVAEDPIKTKLSFPFNQRWGLAVWDFLFTPHTRFTSSPAHDDNWNRGAYLVQGLGHCSACHTPRTIFYNENAYNETKQVFLSGHVIDDWYAPDLRGNPASGLGRWHENEIAEFLKTGHANGIISFGGMNQAIEESTQHMTAADRASIAHYLKSLRATEESAAYNPAVHQTVKIAYPIEHPGAGIYAGMCAGCHGGNGEGNAASHFPKLAGNSAVLARDPASLIHIVLTGGNTPATINGPPPVTMPPFAQLTDVEIGEVLSYIRNAWGNQAKPISAHQVAAHRQAINKHDRQKAAAAAKAPS